MTATTATTATDGVRSYRRGPFLIYANLTAAPASLRLPTPGRPLLGTGFAPVGDEPTESILLDSRSPHQRVAHAVVGKAPHP
jgi:hypothetical protein